MSENNEGFLKKLSKRLQRSLDNYNKMDTKQKPLGLLKSQLRDKTENVKKKIDARIEIIKRIKKKAS